MSTKWPPARFSNHGLTRAAEHRRSDAAVAMADKDTKAARRTRRRKRRRKAAAIPLAPSVTASLRRRYGARNWLLAVGVLLTCAPLGWLFVLYPLERGPGEGRAAEVVVPHNPSPHDIAATLAAAGVVARPHLFALWMRLTGGAHWVVEGHHLVTDDASPRELLARLERRGASATARVTFPEGWTRFEMAHRLEEKHVVTLRSFLNATSDASLMRELGLEGDSAEGFLFPATYDLPLDSDGRDIVRRMKREFDRRWDLLSRAHSASLTDVMSSAGLSVHDLVTLSSMVEKEAAVDDERPIIASVFLNRLRDPSFRPKHLECDPTASYGCLVAPERAPSCADFSGKATAAIQHDRDNPYSTYTHEGLPP
ncbi:MAG TPA: endolytic transglycosylase MltG, partial [Polyangiaceae bacterium]|nr:endolytic transglycosylase MltG [Polyangiaceae bacterium]